MSDHQFELQAEELGGALVIRVSGRIDGVNAQMFQTDLDQQATDSAESHAVILDLEDLTYISSAGLRSVLLLAKSLKGKNKQFALCSLPDTIQEIIEITGFDKIIAIHDSRDAAVAAAKH